MQTERNKILVVGDWFVDEHWVIGIHRSPTSSRTGPLHHRALHLPTSAVESLCGAGRTASILDNVMHRGKKRFEVIGIGVWHDADTSELEKMLNPAHSRGKTLHQVTRETSPNSTLRPTSNTDQESQAKTTIDAAELVGGSNQTPRSYEGADADRTADGRLFNLGTLSKIEQEENGRGTESHKYGTTRIIRLYQQTGARVDLLQRIDWELPPPSREQGWHSEEAFSSGADLVAFYKKHSDSICAVVIKDMGKGVVSAHLIAWLADQQKDCDVPWFVSTKVSNPPWFELLPKQRVRLLVVPQMAAHWEVAEGRLTRWILRSGTPPGRCSPSKGALDYLSRLGKLLPRARVVALPDGLSVLARDVCDESRSEERVGILQDEVGPDSLTAGMPMASVFFPTMVAHLIENEHKDLHELLLSSLRFTHRWMSLEVGRVDNPKDWEPADGQTLTLDRGEKEQDELGGYRTFEGRWQRFFWQPEMSNWTKAFSKHGLVVAPPKEADQGGSSPKSRIQVAGKEKKIKQVIELWRSMTEVDGYVCCVKSNRKKLRAVVNELATFRASDKHPKSCLFIASPGFGKSFLAECLARTLNLRYLGFNITQMTSKIDLLDCFDTIVTTQAQDRERPLLVFIDEINARLDGQHVYDAFLAPLEQGVYVRAGKTFHIEPCVWVFVGTERPSLDGTSNSDKSQKASDFESRLTLGPLDLRTRIKPGSLRENEARVEKVYLGVSLLRSVFPDVGFISEKVLNAFHSLPPELQARELKHFVQAFRNIQYGEVRAKNVPDKQFRKLCGPKKTSDWRKYEFEPEKHDDLIEIKG